MPIVFYDLVDKAGSRYSPYGWRVRMALLHKRLDFQVELCHHSDRKLAFSKQNLVPVLTDNGRVVCDSWNIATYLDEAYPGNPLLLNDPSTRSFAKFLNKWTDTVIGRPLVRSLYLDIWRSLHPDVDAAAFRATREKRNGSSLEELHSRREEDFAELNRAISPLNSLLSDQDYISGPAPAYADYIVFGTLQMPHALGGIEPLAPDQAAIRAWRERMRQHHESLSEKSLGKRQATQ